MKPSGYRLWPHMVTYDMTRVAKWNHVGSLKCLPHSDVVQLCMTLNTIVLIISIQFYLMMSESIQPTMLQSGWSAICPLLIPSDAL